MLLIVLSDGYNAQRLILCCVFMAEKRRSGPRVPSGLTMTLILIACSLEKLFTITATAPYGEAKLDNHTFEWIAIPQSVLYPAWLDVFIILSGK